MHSADCAQWLHKLQIQWQTTTRSSDWQTMTMQFKDSATVTMQVILAGLAYYL